MKSSQVISRVRMELQSNISETAYASIITVEATSDTTARCICTHDWLSEPYPDDRGTHRPETLDSYIADRSRRLQCVQSP
jgi:hypothetical protein